MKQNHILLFTIIAFLNYHSVNSIVCYQCTDCPEPFTTDYPYVTLTNNTNFLAQCTKSIVTLSDGRRMISKGSVFYCPSQTTTGDVQLYCCGSDYCNSSSRLSLSILLFLLIFLRI